MRCQKQVERSIGQQIHRQLPAVAGLAEHAVGGHHDVVEVHLAELVDAVHGPQRAHVIPGLSMSTKNAVMAS